MGIKKPHVYKVGEVVNDGLKIVSQTTFVKNDKNRKRTEKAYIVKSLAFPDDKNDYMVVERSLKSGAGCPYSSTPIKRVIDENSLYSVEWIRPYLTEESIKLSKTITPYSNKSISFKCPECNLEKTMTPHNVIRRNGISCLVCSRGTSYPELFFAGYNSKKEAGFTPQQRFDDFEGYIFDSVNYKRRIIVETHGIAHYKEGNGFHDHKRTVASDIAKRKYCKENNWTLIELDCRVSSFEHIRNSIANEPLLENITDEDVKGMLKIMENNKRYPVKEIVKLYTVEMKSLKFIGERFKVDYGTVKNILVKNNVQIRDYKRELPKKELIELYVNEKLSCKAIGEKYGVDATTVKRQLNNHGVTLRPRGTNQYRITLKID